MQGNAKITFHFLCDFHQKPALMILRFSVPGPLEEASLGVKEAGLGTCRLLRLSRSHSGDYPVSWCGGLLRNTLSQLPDYFSF